MKPAIIHWEAEEELLGSVEFYESRQPGLGLEFGVAVGKAVAAIQADPERYPVHKNGTHRLVIERFPFVIHYVVVPDAIWILAFAHTSRKPGYWKERL